ncbi:MAG: GerMN domain-containing protein [Bacillota bacterium]
MRQDATLMSYLARAGVRAARTRRLRSTGTRLLGAALAILLLVGPGCARNQPPGPPPAGQPQPQPPTHSDAPAPGSGSSPVVVFLSREGKLEAALRTVSGPEDRYPTAAVEALVAGPTARERDAGLGPVLPASTRVLGVEIERGVATANLSREVITRASEVGVSSTTEALALNALYFTLAQFRGVEKVRLLVEGKNRGPVDGRLVEDFWGHIGLPEYLTGNPRILSIPTRQEVGEITDGLRLRSLRWASHPAVFRVVFEIDNPDGTPAPLVPATIGTWSASGVIQVTINAMRATAVKELKPGGEVELDDWRVAMLRWEVTEDDQAFSFSLALRPGRAYGWRLWSLPDPCRVLVDVFACGSALAGFPASMVSTPIFWEGIPDRSIE